MGEDKKFNTYITTFVEILVRKCFDEYISVSFDTSDILSYVQVTGCKISSSGTTFLFSLFQFFFSSI